MTPFSALDRRHFLKLSAGASALAGTLGLSHAVAATVTSLDDIVALSALDLSRAIRTGDVSCREVMTAYLDHIERYNPTYNAIVAIQPRDRLLDQATQADDDLAKGNYRGWMHGFPHAVKDLSATRGIVTTRGSALSKDWIPDVDAIFVERLRRAGAILIGKTNVPEFGLGSQSYNGVYGTTRNAYDHSLCAGGSSGGAAVGLATQMLPVADGSDMMGSLRNPAAFNNVIGFRPSQGRVPHGPSGEMFYQQLGYEGPMGRNVADTTRLLATMAGFDSRVPLSLETDTSRYVESLKMETRGLRVAWLGDFGGYLATEPGVLEVCQEGLKHLVDIGASVEAVAVDFSMDELWQTWLTLRHFLIAGGLGRLYDVAENRPQMKPEVIWEIEGGLTLNAMQVYAASNARSRWYQTLDRLFDTFDVVALPSAQVFPFDADIHWPKEIDGRPMDTYHRWMEVVIAGTLSGCPVINVPAGFDPRGRPMGIQLIGRMHQDLKVLNIAHAYEQASGLLAQRPTLVPGAG
ncbi:amidase [Halomonas sp. V046]|uniref:amidase n=1 Tax=Halomonas sp. V046 TaxID=3459611 RepID=UPI00404430E9